MYLMIQNEGEAPIESFTVFGASTARGDADKIGQFGSGAKFGILACMRKNITPAIFSGRDKLHFFTEPMVMGGEHFRRVCYKHNTKTERTSYTLEFGELDWKKTVMGLREFVSNALDAVSGDKSKVTISIEQNARAKAGFTRVFVPFTDEVNEFFCELHKYFLQFREGANVSEEVMTKQNPSAATVYRKGVMVRQVGDRNSLFDYNFGEDLDIDESRNLDDYTAKAAISRKVAKLSDPNRIDEMLEAIVSNKDILEVQDINGYYIKYGLKNNTLWADRFHKVYGDHAIIVKGEHAPLLDRIQNKGFRAILCQDSSWFDGLKNSGIKTVFDVMDDINEEGHVISDASPQTMATANRVWGWITTLDMHANKEMPKVKEFTANMDSEGRKVHGYYKDDTIYIEKDALGSTQTYLEEFAHYVTDAGDGQRAFQDYAFKLASLMGELMG